LPDSRRLFSVTVNCILCLFCLALMASFPSAAAGGLDFNRDIRPILSENCFYCHGQDAAQRKADLRLDQRQGALDGKAFIPGDPDHSELIRRLTTADPDDVMPPPDSHRTVTEAQKARLRQWIAEGAPYADPAAPSASSSAEQGLAAQSD
jgi:mono/diheme cytochrome c family protein